MLALAIESLAEHVVLFDSEDRIVIANKAWRDLNSDIAEFTTPGTRFEDHLRAVIANGLAPAALGHEEEWLRERMARHVNPTGPFDVRRQNGRWIRIFEQRLPDNGTILIISDITKSKQVEQALRESEVRFRAVVNNSPAKIHFKDADGRYILINTLAAKLFGVIESEALGKTTHDIFPKDKADTFTAHDKGVLDSGMAVEGEEQWPHEGSVRTYLTVKFPIFDPAEKIIGTGAIGTDITDRKQTEERLQQSEKNLQLRIVELERVQRKLEKQETNLIRLAQDLSIARDQAEAANRAKTEFLASMSHELRTPLNAIIGFSEIIQDGILGPIGNAKYSSYAKDIHESGTHLLDLINDILDLAKVEAGIDELYDEDIKIPELTRSVWPLVQQRAEQQGVKLVLDQPEEPPRLRGDLRKLKQILVNLISNAIKFTDGGGEVSLKVSCHEDKGYIFQVADNGIGIAPEDIPKAMSQFGQVDSTLNRKHEGTGLGLPLTRALVEMHGGTLDLQSQPDVGTVVTVRFPADRIVPVTDQAKTSA